MLNPLNFLLSSAYAQEPVAAPQGGSEVLMNYLPFILIFLVFYVLVIRPQQKRLADQDKMVKALQRGDRVVTNGGLHGKIAKVEDKTFMLEIADGVQVKIERDSVATVEAKTQPAAAKE